MAFQPPSTGLADRLSPNILHEQRFTVLRTARVGTVQRGPGWEGGFGDFDAGAFALLFNCHPET